MNRGLAQLRRQEKSLRYLARVDHETVQEFVLSLLLEPLFDEKDISTGQILESRPAVSN